MPRTIPSPWGDKHDPVTVSRLPQTFGDGQQSVLVSFYGAPECVIEVMVDSDLPLDLGLEERCQECVEIRSFRDLMPQIWDLLEDTWSDPPLIGDFRTQQLNEELALEGNEGSMWELIRRDGSTWCTGHPITPQES